MTTAFGIDVGGSGIKGALVDLEKGQIIGERIRIETPEESTPEAICDICNEIVTQFELGEDVPIGIDFPAPLPDGLVSMIANLDKSWVGKNLSTVMSTQLGRPVYALNDADAAGLAELRYGAGLNKKGVVIVTTLGTGIGSALFIDGILVPNTEFGHIEIDGKDAEQRAAASVRKKKDLDWKQWSKRLQKYYSALEHLLWPSLIIVGGGVSRKHEKFLPLLDLRAPIVPAQLRNTAGIVGAAVYAFEKRTANM